MRLCGQSDLATLSVNTEVVRTESGELSHREGELRNHSCSIRPGLGYAVEKRRRRRRIYSMSSAGMGKRVSRELVARSRREGKKKSTRRGDVRTTEGSR